MTPRPSTLFKYLHLKIRDISVPRQYVNITKGKTDFRAHLRWFQDIIVGWVQLLYINQYIDSTIEQIRITYFDIWFYSILFNNGKLSLTLNSTLRLSYNIGTTRNFCLYWQKLFKELNILTQWLIQFAAIISRCDYGSRKKYYYFIWDLNLNSSLLSMYIIFSVYVNKILLLHNIQSIQEFVWKFRMYIITFY